MLPYILNTIWKAFKTLVEFLVVTLLGSHCWSPDHPALADESLGIDWLAGKGSGGCWDRNMISEAPSTRKNNRNTAGKRFRFGFIFILLVAKKFI